MNEEEFDRIVLEYQGVIWKVCRTFFRDEEDIKDLFQDILLNLWKGRLSFKGISKLSTWIYRISLNQAIDKSRKNRLKTTELTVSVSDREADIQNTQNTNYDIEALYMGIAQLNPIEKGIIFLYLEQKTNIEIADVIGISPNNVSVKLVRIKEKLKVHYEKITRKNG